MGMAWRTAELDGQVGEIAHVPAAPPAMRPRTSELEPAMIEACKRGDALALRRFVVCKQRLVFAFLSRMVGRGPHVEDLAQEVFLRAHRALPRYEIREGARGACQRSCHRKRHDTALAIGGTRSSCLTGLR
jgi:DNA-directed RNA polymerase sigma subunit (sigma70/sigma32)